MSDKNLLSDISDKSGLKKAVLFSFISVIITRIAFYLLYVIHCGDNSFSGFLARINFWDAIWYKSIVTEGYPAMATGQASWAFFPLYPLTVRVFHVLLGTGIDLTGFMISNICCFISCIYSYRYIMYTRKNHEEAIFYLAIMLYGVCGFYESIMYTEAMYLMFLSMCFYYMSQEKYILMGISGILMSATRNTGVFFVFAVLFFWIHQYMEQNSKPCIKEFIKKTANNESLISGTLMIPMGLFLYMFYLWKHVGDPLAFVHIQKAFMLDTKPGIISVVIRAVQLYGNQLWFYAYMIGLFAVLIMICTGKKSDEKIWGIINWFIPLQRGLGCMHRYLHIALTVELVFSDYCMKAGKKIRYLILILMVIAEGVLMLLWLDHNGWLV